MAKKLGLVKYISYIYNVNKNKLKTHQMSKGIRNKVEEESSSQNMLNERFLTLINEMSDTITLAGTNSDMLLRLVQQESKRTDSLENKMDILMSERLEMLTEKYAAVRDDIDDICEDTPNDIDWDGIPITASCPKFEFDPRVSFGEFEKRIGEHLERVQNQNITPISLLNLGFTERYQEPDTGEAGYIYYSFDKHGINLTSSIVGDTEEFYVLNDGTQREIHSFTKLKTLIEAVSNLE